MGKLRPMRLVAAGAFLGVTAALALWRLGLDGWRLQIVMVLFAGLGAAAGWRVGGLFSRNDEEREAGVDMALAAVIVAALALGVVIVLRM